MADMAKWGKYRGKWGTPTVPTHVDINGVVCHEMRNIGKIPKIGGIGVQTT